MPTYRYKTIGVTQSQIQNILSVGTTVSVSSTMPESFQDVTINDSNELSNLTDYMSSVGYSFSESSPEVSAAKSILQIQSNRLTSNLATINVGAGFVDVLSLDIKSKGNSAFGIVASLSATVLVGGSIRITINGGTFSNQVLMGQALPVLGGGGASFTVPLIIPSSTSYTTYTVKLQAQAIGLLASVSVDAATNPGSSGATLVVFEYA